MSPWVTGVGLKCCRAGDLEGQRELSREHKQVDEHGGFQTHILGLDERKHQRWPPLIDMMCAAAKHK